MMRAVSLLVVALSAALAAPAPSEPLDLDYPGGFANGDIQYPVILPQKRAALVLDRLLIALQNALHEEAEVQRLDVDRDGPRVAPLRVPNIDTSSNDMTGLQRRGQGSRGRVIRCYFNAVTCF